MNSSTGSEEREAAQQFLADNKINRIRVQGIQPDSLPIGKILHPRTFLSCLESGVGIVDYAFGTDRAGEPAFGFSADWRSTVMGDVHLVPDLSTLVVVPEADGLAMCLADAIDAEGKPIPVCGRGLVRGLSEQLAAKGYQSLFAFELEGQFFERSFAENRAAGWKRLTPFGVASMVPYLVQDLHRLDDVMTEICSRLDGYGVPWEAWNAEAAAGQFELNLMPTGPLAAADHVILARQVCKEVAFERGLSVTFMARVTQDYGNGLHVHHSLQDESGPVFFDPAEDDNLSVTARHWLAGLMATLQGSVSIMVPTPNSFRRAEPFKAVPTHATWDMDNKSTALRVLSGSAGSARIEHRVGAGDVHPHFAAAVILAGGLAGLDDKVEPPAKFTKMAWGLPSGPGYPEELARSVPAAGEALGADERLRRMLGDGFVDYWIGLRRFEWLAFNTGGGDAASPAPTPWELDRYFETL